MSCTSTSKHHGALHPFHTVSIWLVFFIDPFLFLLVPSFFFALDELSFFQVRIGIHFLLFLQYNIGSHGTGSWGSRAWKQIERKKQKNKRVDMGEFTWGFISRCDIHKPTNRLHSACGSGGETCQLTLNMGQEDFQTACQSQLYCPLLCFNGFTPSTHSANKEKKHPNCFGLSGSTPPFAHMLVLRHTVTQSAGSKAVSPRLTEENRQLCLHLTTSS